MDKIYVNSQFINNLNGILGKRYFDVIVLKSSNPLEPITYEIFLVYEKEFIMRIKLSSGKFEIANESDFEKNIINNLMDSLERMMLNDLMFGKVIYATDNYGNQIKTLRSCIFEIENSND